MLKGIGKRLIASLLALLMIISAVSVNFLVMGVDPEDYEGLKSFFGIEESDPLWESLVEMNSVLVRYLGASTASDDEISVAVRKMNEAERKNAVSDIEGLSAFTDKLNEEQMSALAETETAKTAEKLYSKLTGEGEILSTAGTVSLLGGKVTVVDSQNTVSGSGNSVSATVTGGLVATKTNTLEIFNNTSSISALSFNYSASNYDSLSLGNATGSYSVVLNAGDSLSIDIKSKAAYQKATLTLSDISLVPVAEKSNVTIAFDSSGGSVTVGGESVSANGVKEITYASGAELVATPVNGAKFLGWVNPENSYILSTSATYKIKPVTDMTIKAVFIGKNSPAYFTAGGNYLFEDLNKASGYASSTGSKLVVLINDGVLPAGNYTIPSDVMLLIPFDGSNTVFTDEPESQYAERILPTAYRTLTMASGANITVNGSICLPARHFAAGGGKLGAGSTNGPCSFIKMNSGSNITVNSGGKLYAYGFIIGDGSVTAKRGAHIYEYFQVMDFRGGTQTTEMENGVFPLSQYYVQNIEVRLTLEVGSTESCYTSFYMSKTTLSSGVAFISESGAMFNLTSGSVTKRYDPSTDRLIVEVNGNISISPIEMKIGTGILSKTINSKNYELPINGNITVIANSGSITLAQDIAMFPGTEIIIRENAKCILASNTNVYVYDSAEWGTFCGAGNKTFIPAQYVPGRKYNRKDADLKDVLIQVDGTLDASAGYLYTTAGGANICSTASGSAILRKGSQAKTYQLVQKTGYTEIPITAAKLKNADGSYFTASGATASCYYVDGVWVEHTNHMYKEVINSAADCEHAGLKTFSCPCGSVYTENIPALGHKAGDAATCTTNQVCTVCGKELNAALGHAYVSVTQKPDCTNGGFTTHTCSRCSYSYTDGIVEAKGHSAGAEATCTTNQICTVCGTELAPVKGHDYKTETTAATCTENGFSVHTCLNCGDSYTDGIVEAKGHSAGADATCTEPQTCTVCGEVLKAENGHTEGAEPNCTEAQVCIVCGTELKPALGHDMVHNDAVDATCTKEGYSSGSVCSRCDYTEGKHVIPAKGHTPGEDATCETAQYCTVCGVRVAGAKGHAYVETVTAPTCTDIGFTTFTCSGCGDTYVDGIVEAKGHTAGKEADCSSPQTCTDCGIVLVPAKQHTPGEEATCTEPQICTVCEEVIAPSKGHTPGTRATCNNPQTCKACGVVLVEVLEHKFTRSQTFADCEHNGITLFTCSRCRYEYIESEVPATGHDMAPASCTEPSKCRNSGCDHTEGQLLGHTLVSDTGIPATCLESGLSEGSHCTQCGHVFVAQYEIPAQGHNVVTHEAKKPTYSSVGWEAYEECTRCDYTTYVEIPKLKIPVISDYETFITNLALLEELAEAYSAEVPGKDPLDLVIKYIRTGVEKYNEGSWGIMAGYEDTGFAEYVKSVEDAYNAVNDEYIIVTGLKNIENFVLPNGDLVDFGHMFGSMDITYHNKKSQNHADVSGWAGDIVDLMEFSDYGGVSGTFDEMIADISKNYLMQPDPDEIGGFNEQDMFGDLDSFCIMRTVIAAEYENGVLTEIFKGYFTKDLTLVGRADCFLKNRLGGVSTRADVRDAVYNAYTGNKLVITLEATKELKTTDVATLRKACCYAFADFICKLAGDYVEVNNNPCFTAFACETSTLAPGIIQNIKHATTADNKQMVYYTATADLSRDDIFVYANYKDNNPAAGWGMQTVLAQANAAQERYGNPESEDYIENYNVIASINGGGYNMETGEPGGLLIMDGKEYHASNDKGFFGITNDGKAVLGTTEEYNAKYKGKLKECIGGFGTMLIDNGEIAITAEGAYYEKRASRTAVGITRTGKVVFMVLDGRQEPISCGGNMIEIAHIMYEAGCVEAINLDGGGSTTYVAKLEGDDNLSVANRPSDGAARSVSTSLIMVSTAPSSTAFHHAIIDSPTDYLTVGSSVQLTASGVSATGNSADLPEVTEWKVSDERYGTITADGLFAAKKNGSVEVTLLDGEKNVIGTKTLKIVVPDRVYFSRTNIDAIYGIRLELPIVALYENKPVTITPSDVTFTLSKPEAGAVDGFGFTGNEASGIKNIVVTAALVSNSEKTASINVSLYNQGEISFDFENATGGDRTFAWERKVSNSVTEDNMVYDIEDREKVMETTYTFAIDMTQIPIPDQLEDLTGMLPGAELETASAWTFLLQLAERVSVLTEVKPVIYIDKNFDVDYSELKVFNEYFGLNSVDYDEEDHSLTLTLNWKDQTQAIDPATANPICILKGIKLTPKADAEWPQDRLPVLNSGEVNYKMYMRASALYKFAQDTSNQQIYGIYPFINPDDPNEKGGYFGGSYADFEDSYVLSKAVKDGWVNEDGGFAYYVDGERVTGVKEIDGVYYDFGDNGINVGQTPLTGIFYDEDDGVYRYSKLGEIVSGWHMIDDEWYYFHTSTLAAKEGFYKAGGVYFNFDKTGRVLDGQWVDTLEGTRYYYGPSYYYRGWYEIDGNTYYFGGGYRYEGLMAVKASASPTTWYDFGTDGVCKGVLDGIYFIDGKYIYIEQGIATEKHLFKYNDDYYYSTYNGVLAVDKTLKTASTNCDLPNGTYTFDSEGKMIGSAWNGEIIEVDGVIYYYEKGVGVEKGLVKVGDDYYYAAYKGKLVVSKSLKIPMTSCDLPIGTYEFGADGKMLKGIVEKDGVLYYYENGAGVEKGLIKYGDDYYYAAYKGKLVVSKSLKIPMTSCDLPIGTYEFGADGKMLNGIVNKDGVLYYYEKGVGVEKGLIKFDGDYYYAAYKGQLVVSKEIKATITNCDLPIARYEFGADGKMLNGIVNKDGVLYYYENGAGVEKGLIKIGDDYYYAAYKGLLAVGKEIKASITNCDLPVGYYEFDAEGKMLNGIINKDGVLYYYENGAGVEKGLFKLGDDYYYAGYKGKLAVSKVVKTTITSCDLPIGSYEFGADGKMLDGIIDKDGVLYYYENGAGAEKGLVKVDGDYYYAAYKGQVVVNKEIKATMVNCDLPVARYEFGADGKMLQGIVNKDGVLYYYENGAGVEKGLIKLDGYYYYTTYKGKLAVNTTINISITNNLLVAGTYTFDENGRLVG